MLHATASTGIARSQIPKSRAARAKDPFKAASVTGRGERVDLVALVSKLEAYVDLRLRLDGSTFSPQRI